MVKLTSTQRLSALTRLSRSGEWTIDIKTNEIWWSDETYTLFNIPKTRKPLDFRKKNSYFDAHELARLSELTTICVQTGVECADTFTAVLSKNFNTKLHITFIPQKNKSGKVTGVYAVWKKITNVTKASSYNDNTHLNSFYKEVMDVVAEDIVIFDAKHRYVYINPKSIRNNAIREWLIGKDDFDYCRYRNRPLALAKNRRKQFNLALKTKKNVPFEETFNTPNGILIFKRVFVPVYDQQNNLKFVVGYGIDITDLKKAEQNNAQFSALVNAATEGIAVLDNNGHYRYVNKAYAHTLGYKSPEELITKAAAARYKHENRIALAKKVIPALKKNNMWEGEYCATKKDGTCVQLEVRFTTLNAEEVVCVFRDIDAKVKQREELQTLALVASRTSSMVTITDKNRILEWVNDSFCKTSGYTFEELIGKDVREVLTGPRTNQSDINLITNETSVGKQSTREILKYNKKGVPFWVYVDVTPILDESGKPYKYISVQNDITHIKEAEEKLRQLLDKERKLSDLKSEFVTIASHEFRTPLSIIQSSADIIKLLKEQQDAASLERKMLHLKHITEQVQRLSALLDDILLLGKAEEGKISYNPISDYLHTHIRKVIDAHKPMFESTLQNIVYTVTGKPKKTLFDKKHIQQIIANLLSNSIKYSQGAKAPEIYTHYGAKEVEIHVKDYGIGVPEEDKSKIFQKFTRAKNVGDINGYGIGLSLVKNLVELHGGSITFNSIQNKETTFIVNIPYTQLL